MTPQLNISFGIITNGERPKKLKKQIDSIFQLRIPEFEITICGHLQRIPDGIKYIEDKYAAENGKLGRMRNLLCRNSRYDILVITDDDMLFAKDFYTELQHYGMDFEILCTRILNPDGSRYWDWAENSSRTHRLLDYHEISKDVYVTGGRCILKKDTSSKIQWDNDKGFYEEEDVDFSKRAKDLQISIKISKALLLIHNDIKYTQYDNIVKRVNLYKLFLRNVRRIFLKKENI